MDGKRLEYKGKAALEEIERLTSEADKVQEEILKEILTRNGETEYLSKYIKMGTNDTSLFRKCVPVITYSDVKPYVQRIENGEHSSLLTGHEITEMLCSSGTSAGEPKMIPSIAEDLDRRTFLYNLIMPIINQYVPGLDEGKAMYLYFVKAEMSTACGLPARAVLTSYYKSKHFKCRAADAFNTYTSPDPAVLCYDGSQSMYCQLLSGLLHRHSVLRLGAVFASALLRAISFLERSWPAMCHDIRLGHLDPASVPDPTLRSAMSHLLPAPDPAFAAEIEGVCAGGSWRGILCRLWPRAKFIEAVVTGSMAQYIPALEYYSDGKLPLVCTMYASSECFFGVNLRPLCRPDDVAFTILPNMGYFEFIPLGENGMDDYAEEDERVPCDKLVDLVSVKRGCYYELVVTTFAGLNRYRMGDVLQVTGFHNKAPQFRFICRRKVLLSIDNDKTNEEDLHKSVSAAKKLLEPRGALLVEYTTCADTSSVPGHYVLFWELQLLYDHHRHHHSDFTATIMNLEYDIILQECCIAVEEELDYIYRRCRANDKSVGPLEIRVVEAGTFEALMDFFISQGGSINQYKTPRCIKSPKALKLLEDSVIARVFSPRDPKWTP